MIQEKDNLGKIGTPHADIPGSGRKFRSQFTKTGKLCGQILIIFRIKQHIGNLELFRHLRGKLRVGRREGGFDLTVKEDRPVKFDYILVETIPLFLFHFSSFPGCGVNFAEMRLKILIGEKLSIHG